MASRAEAFLTGIRQLVRHLLCPPHHRVSLYEAPDVLVLLLEELDASVQLLDLRLQLQLRDLLLDLFVPPGLLAPELSRSRVLVYPRRVRHLPVGGPGGRRMNV